ncbi:hypothetical protein D9758_017603 [Tetrapyrgos nigripes]|uniref:Uncharacterized protein n=1 Tax=Tetrapyrgos nigripes TaxID=182062 RepID=A0A8H5BBK9_9AGAR|nr:hypothetical protein D9758_017603 [Tetrapyrgos nigripes]
MVGGERLSIPLPDYIRLLTTIVTNALLMPKGTRHSFSSSVALINNQSRPKIVAERVTLVGYTSDPAAEEH